MGKKAIAAATFVYVILISILAGTQVVERASGNPWFMYKYVEPYPGTVPPIITVFSPTNGSSITSNDFTLNFTISKPVATTSSTVGITYVEYTLDGKTTVLYDFSRLPVQSLTSPGVQEFNQSNNIILSAGSHNLTIYASAIVLLGNMTFFDTDSTANVSFEANNTRFLAVVVNSPQNRTYTSNGITISVSASDPRLQIGPQSVAYILDGNPQIVLGETTGLGLHNFTNSTTRSLTDGTHSITGVGITWFNGADGVFYSQPIYFTVDTNPLHSSTMLSLIAVAVAAAVAMIVLVYLRKRRT